MNSLNCAAYLAVILAVAFNADTSFGADFPAKPTRVVIPFAAGGTTDIVGRALADKLAPRMGQPVIVENRPGAGSLIGTDVVAKAAPDGYTLLMSGGPLATFKLLFKSVPFDVKRDLAPVTQITRTSYIVMINGGLPAKNLGEFITYAKANPGKLNFGSIGPGGVYQAHELFKKLTDINMVAIPYKGAMPVNALPSNEIQFYMDGSLVQKPNIDAGKVRALAVVANRRLAALPDVPTIAEAGLPNFTPSNWQGFMITAGSPKDVIAKWNAEIVAVAAMPDFRQRVTALGTEVVTNSPEELGRMIDAEMTQWAEVARFANVQPE